MENIIKNRTIPCFVFQATALISGLALMLLRGMGLDALVSNLALGLKFLLLLLSLACCLTCTLVCNRDLMLSSPKLGETWYRRRLLQASMPSVCGASAWHPSACS